MDTEFILAIIVAIIEAIVAAASPYLISKISNKKSITIARQKVLPQYSQKINDSAIEVDINQIFEQHMEPQKTENNTSIYLREYNASIDIYIDGDKTQITSSYTLTFVNPYKQDYVFKRKPMLREGLEFDTYQFKDIRYMGQIADRNVTKYHPHEQRTHNENYRFKYGLEIPLTKDVPESVLHYGAQYFVEGAKFFNAYYFWHYCKNFAIDVRLSGPDASKYEIRWAVFLPTNRRTTSVERNIHCEQSDHVFFSANGWIFPSDGYVITINKKA